MNSSVILESFTETVAALINSTKSDVFVNITNIFVPDSNQIIRFKQTIFRNDLGLKSADESLDAVEDLSDTINVDSNRNLWTAALQNDVSASKIDLAEISRIYVQYTISMKFRTIATSVEFPTMESSALNFANSTAVTYLQSVRGGQFNTLFLSSLLKNGLSNTTSILLASSQSATFDQFKFVYLLPSPTALPSAVPTSQPSTFPTASSNQASNLNLSRRNNAYLGVTFLLIYAAVIVCLVAVCALACYFRVCGAYFRMKNENEDKYDMNADFGIIEDYSLEASMKKDAFDPQGGKLMNEIGDSFFIDDLYPDSTESTQDNNHPGIIGLSESPRSDNDPSLLAHGWNFSIANPSSILSDPTKQASFYSLPIVEDVWTNARDSVGIVFDEMFNNDNLKMNEDLPSDQPLPNEGAFVPNDKRQIESLLKAQKLEKRLQSMTAIVNKGFSSSDEKELLGIPTRSSTTSTAAGRIIRHVTGTSTSPKASLLAPTYISSQYNNDFTNNLERSPSKSVLDIFSFDLNSEYHDDLTPTSGNPTVSAAATDSASSLLFDFAVIPTALTNIVQSIIPQPAKVVHIDDIESIREIIRKIISSDTVIKDMTERSRSSVEQNYAESNSTLDTFDQNMYSSDILVLLLREYWLELSRVPTEEKLVLTIEEKYESEFMMREWLSKTPNQKVSLKNFTVWLQVITRHFITSKNQDRV